MSFLNDAMLWGLPLAAIPLVFHLLSRRHRHVLRWAAMQFLEPAAVRRRRWKIREWLLLILRTATVLALVLAMARPLVQSRWVGSPGPRDLVLVLDVSMSTAQADGEQSDSMAGRSRRPRLFERLVQNAGDIINQLGPNDTCRILLAGAEPNWLVVEPVWASPVNRASLRERLNTLEPNLAGADWIHCLREAVRVPAADSKAVRIITALTDGQARGWHAETLTDWEEVKDSLRSESGRFSVSAYAAPGSKNSLCNLSVENVSTPRSIMAVGDMIPFSAIIRNTGAVATAVTVATWEAGSQIIGRSVVSVIEPGQTATTRVEWAPEQLGSRHIRCSVESPDDLSLDNCEGYVIEAVSGLPVLIVDGTLRTDPVWTDTGYLSATLGPARREEGGAWQSPFRPEVIPASGLSPVDLGQYSCVVLANVSVLPEQVIAPLKAFVRAGGGLWLLLGDQTTPAVYAAQFGDGPDPLIPYTLADPVESPPAEQTEHVRVAARPHPATRLLDDPDRLDLERIRIHHRHRFVTEHRSDRTCVLLSTDQSEPLAVEASYGQGRVIAQAIPLNPSWSNLPACQAFVVWVHEWLWYLSEPSRTRRNLNPGEPIELLATGDSGAASLVLPWGESVPLHCQKAHDRTILRYEHTRLPGLYEIVSETPQAAPDRQLFQIKRDPGESDLTRLTDAERRHLAADLGLRFVTDPLEAVRVDPAIRPFEPAWSFLLWALVLVLLSESLVAGWSGRTRTVRSSTPGMNAS